jgi:hypothetical protein
VITMTDMTGVDKLAMIVGGSFVVLGTVVLGIVEALVGSPSPVPVTNEAGQVVAATTFPVEVRAALIALGLLVWFAAGVYKLIAREPRAAAASAPTGTATE